MHTAILGAGVSGLAAAYGVSKIPGYNYSVFDQNTCSGGLCKTVSQDGFTYDTVAHVLHFRSKERENLVKELLGGNLLEGRRNAQVRFRNRLVPYPFQAHLGFLPLTERSACLMGYASAWLKRRWSQIKEPVNFEQWVESSLGNGIGRHFMYPYNKKLWGIHAKEMSTDWLRSFVPEIGWKEIIASLQNRPSNHSGYNATFYYPRRGGIQALTNSLGKRLSHVFMGHQAVSIDLKRKVILFQNGKQIFYDRLISTLPLKTMATLCTDLPEAVRHDATMLKSTSLLSLVFCLNRPQTHNYHWIYYPESPYPYFRLVFPSNVCRSMAPENCSIVSAEISMPDMTRAEELEAAVGNSLLEQGFISQMSDIRFCQNYHFQEAYPVHDLGRQARVSRLTEYFRAQGVWTIGRFGGWRYSSIDDALEEGLCAAREIVETVPAIARRAASVGN